MSTSNPPPSLLPSSWPGSTRPSSSPGSTQAPQQPSPTGIRALWNNGPILLALCMLSWAGSIITGRAAAALVPPSLFTLCRWGGALLIVLPLAWPHLRRDGPALRRRWPVIAALAVLGVDAYNNLVYRGLHSTSAVNALLLQSVMPLFVLLAVFALFRERPSLRQIAAIVISIAGVLAIAGRGSLATLATMQFNPGDTLVIIALVCYALYSALLRLRPSVHPFSLLAASFAIGVLLLIPLAIQEYLGGARLQPTPLALGSIVYAAIFPAFVSYLFYNRGVELIGPARAGQYIHLMPVFGVVLAMIFLGETLLPYHLVGITLIAFGLWLAR